MDEHKDLEDTAAGREVDKGLQQAKQEYQARTKDLEEGYQQALQDREEDVAEMMLQQQKEYEQKLEKATQGQEDLKISLQRLSEKKTAQYQ